MEVITTQLEEICWNGGVVGGDIRFILTAAKTPDTKTTSGFPEQEAASVTTGFSLESQQC